MSIFLHSMTGDIDPPLPADLLFIILKLLHLILTRLNISQAYFNFDESLNT